MTHDSERTAADTVSPRLPTGPPLPRPDLRQFIDTVIVPALLERLLRQHKAAA